MQICPIRSKPWLIVNLKSTILLQQTNCFIAYKCTWCLFRLGHLAMLKVVQYSGNRRWCSVLSACPRLLHSFSRTIYFPPFFLLIWISFASLLSCFQLKATNAERCHATVAHVRSHFILLSPGTQDPNGCVDHFWTEHLIIWICVKIASDARF